MCRTLKKDKSYLSARGNTQSSLINDSHRGLEENVNKYPSWFLRQLQRACLSKSHPGSLTKVLSTLLDDFNSQHIYLIYPVCGFLSDSEYDNLSMYSICLSILAWRYKHKFCKALSLFSCKPFFFSLEAYLGLLSSWKFNLSDKV